MDELRPETGARVELRRRSQDEARVVYAVRLHLPEGPIDGEATLDRATGRSELEVEGAPEWLRSFATGLLRQIWTSRRDADATFPHRVLRWREAKG
ncbi:MAG: hypothetical protein H6720_17165 [Sandaracinus sp.]|nr:hypothetical protein [Sandaracinus sp.]